MNFLNKKAFYALLLLTLFQNRVEASDNDSLYSNSSSEELTRSDIEHERRAERARRRGEYIQQVNDSESEELEEGEIYIPHSRLNALQATGNYGGCLVLPTMTTTTIRMNSTQENQPSQAPQQPAVVNSPSVEDDQTESDNEVDGYDGDDEKNDSESEDETEQQTEQEDTITSAAKRARRDN